MVAATYLGSNTVEPLRQLSAYVSKRTGLDVVFEQADAENSKQAVETAKNVDIVWACGLLTIDMIDAGVIDAEIVAAPVFPGENGPMYHSVLVSRVESGFDSLRATAGSRLAINERESWSGHHGLVAYLADLGLDLANYSEMVLSGGHLLSVDAVRDGRADVASIDHTIWEDLQSDVGPFEDLQVIDRSPDWPAPPFSLRLALDTDVRAQLTEALTSVVDGTIDGLSAIVPAAKSTYTAVLGAENDRNTVVYNAKTGG